MNHLDYAMKGKTNRANSLIRLIKTHLLLPFYFGTTAGQLHSFYI